MPQKAFIKPFEAPQRSVQIKIEVYFYCNTTFSNAQGQKGQRIKTVQGTSLSETCCPRSKRVEPKFSPNSGRSN